MDTGSAPRATHRAADALCLLLKDLDERVANDLPLRLGVSDARKLAQEEVRGVDGVQVHAAVVAQPPQDLRALVLAQHAVVDEDGVEARADGAVEENGCDGRIDAARDCADDPALLAHRPLDALDGLCGSSSSSNSSSGGAVSYVGQSFAIAYSPEGTIPPQIAYSMR